MNKLDHDNPNWCFCESCNCISYICEKCGFGYCSGCGCEECSSLWKEIDKLRDADKLPSKDSVKFQRKFDPKDPYWNGEGDASSL